jgi:hypothetical protein
MHFGFSTLCLSCFLCGTPYDKKMKELTQSCTEEALNITEKNKSSIKD